MVDELPPPPPAPLRQRATTLAPAVLAPAAPKPSTSPVQTIAVDALSKLTGFTDAELRLLANRHYFPKDKNGFYELTPAITGCFRRRKEQAESADGLPTYESIGQCAGQTGIPQSLLKQAKKAGCEAFKAHRVILAPLLRWLFDKGESDRVNWGDELKKFQALREKIKWEEDSDLSVNKADISFGINKGMSLFFASFDRLANLELPPALKGLPETEIQKRLVESAEALKAIVRAELVKLTEAKKQDSKDGDESPGA